MSRLFAGRRSPDVAMLTDAGVVPTTGEAGGRLAAGVEGLAQRMPIAKSIVGEQQQRAIESFNPALWNRVLAGIDEKLPDTVSAGHEANEKGRSLSASSISA